MANIPFFPPNSGEGLPPAILRRAAQILTRAPDLPEDATEAQKKRDKKIRKASGLPPLPPTLDDPEIAAARERQRQAELRRRGRRASMLTGGRGVEDPLGTVNRPQARAATNLGQTGM